MEEKYLRKISEAKGSFLVFRQDEVMLSNGRKTKRDVILHPGAVAVLAVTPKEEIILVKQYRYPVGKVTYEIPAGKLEKGEEPLMTAQRELAEETGYRAKEWKKLTAFYAAPGYANEVIHLFLAENLQKSAARPDPDEIIDYEKMTIKEAYNQVLAGEIDDAKTIMGILWLVNSSRYLDL